MDKVNERNKAIRVIENMCDTNDIPSDKYIAMIGEKPLDKIVDMIIDEAVKDIIKGVEWK